MEKFQFPWNLNDRAIWRKGFQNSVEKTARDEGNSQGRYIGENIRLTTDILEQTKAQDIPGILLLLDFRKAFDTVEWGFIQNTLDLFNFGSNIKQWVKTCNYDFKFLEKSGIPIFYRKISANFLEIRNLYQHDNGQDLILFNNKDILIDGNSFFLQKWKQKGVILIQDILDNDGKFLTFTSCQDRFKIKCNFLSYLQVISAIPKRLLHKARSLGRWENLTAYETTFPLTPSSNIDLHKMKCKSLIGLIQNSIALFLQRLMKYYLELI